MTNSSGGFGDVGAWFDHDIRNVALAGVSAIYLTGIAYLTVRLLRRAVPNYVPHSFPKKCACGRVFTKSQWKRLPHPPAGDKQFLPWGEIQELRNCPCGSTLVVVVKEGDADW